jgi:hypothetical protein
MKVNVEIDCTPQEARAMMGLPDLTPLHDRYVAMLGETMEGGIKPEMVEQMMRGWAPMGEAGLAMWRRMLEGTTKA